VPEPSTSSPLSTASSTTARRAAKTWSVRPERLRLGGDPISTDHRDTRAAHHAGAVGVKGVGVAVSDEWEGGYRRRKGHSSRGTPSPPLLGGPSACRRHLGGQSPAHDASLTTRRGQHRAGLLDRHTRRGTRARGDASASDVFGLRSLDAAWHPIPYFRAAGRGALRSAPVAPRGSGSSRLAGPQRQTRPEARTQAQARFQAVAWGPEITPHLLWKTVGNSCLCEPQALRA